MIQKNFKDIIEDVQKTREPVKLVTHDGQCHADDVYCAALLILMFRTLGIETEVIRTRDESILDTFPSGNYIVFDVFDGILDHHNNFKKSKTGYIRPLASIGRLWRFGKEEFLKVFRIDEKSWKAIDNKFIAFLDMTDCLGISNVVNPTTFLFNHLRDSQEDLDKAWEVCLNQSINDWNALLTTERKNSELRPMFDALPVLDINGKSYKKMLEYIPPVGDVSDIDGIIWLTDRGLKLRLLNNNQFKLDNNNPSEDIIFQNNWLVEVRDADSLFNLEVVEKK